MFMGMKSSNYIFQNHSDKHTAEIQVLYVSAINARKELTFTLGTSCRTYQMCSPWNA